MLPLTRRRLVAMATLAIGTGVGAGMATAVAAQTSPWAGILTEHGVATLGILPADQALLPPLAVVLQSFPTAGSLLDHLTAPAAGIDAALLPPALVPAGRFHTALLDLGPAPAQIIARRAAPDGLPIGRLAGCAHPALRGEDFVDLPGAMLLPNLAAGTLGGAVLPSGMAEAARALGLVVAQLPPTRALRAFVLRDGASGEGAFT